MFRSLNRGRPHTSYPALADKPGVPGWSGRAHRPVRSSTASPGPMRTLAWFSQASTSARVTRVPGSR